MAIAQTRDMEIPSGSMYERLQGLVDEYGEVMIRLDSGEEAELHRHNTEFVDEPMVKVVTNDAIHWFDAEKVESCWIHFDF